jgi:NAD(P)-dependent dehydrogenase (short-subunit alcohol dehydrogenase family)
MAMVAVVTGSSSGIGYEISLLLARNRFTTYATMRNLNKGDRLREIASKEGMSGNKDLTYYRIHSNGKEAR